jgi:hypothetical protein
LQRIFVPVEPSSQEKTPIPRRRDLLGLGEIEKYIDLLKVRHLLLDARAEQRKSLLNIARDKQD